MKNEYISCFFFVILILYKWVEIEFRKLKDEKVMFVLFIRLNIIF